MDIRERGMSTQGVIYSTIDKGIHKFQGRADCKQCGCWNLYSQSSLILMDKIWTCIECQIADKVILKVAYDFLGKRCFPRVDYITNT